jgi:hypothetical protein
MAWQILITDRALADLREIVEFIAHARSAVADLGPLDHFDALPDGRVVHSD